jgi:4-amino-4-deoxy-L-arabinose transferase-like glycosyltransferase
MSKQKLIPILSFLLILGIASFFRLWKITSIPGGLFPDEAANGLDVLLIFQGHHTPFFERGLGREALFIYLQALSVKIFGIGVWQMHLVSAIIGILTVIATFLLAKNLFNLRVAFLASFFLATSSWHVTCSRTGFRAIMVPLMATLFFYFAHLTFKETSEKKRKLFAILSGIVLGLGFYTYISFRAMVGIIGILGLAILLFERNFFKKFWREIILGLISMLLVITPLALYFMKHPGSFTGRAYYVSIFNPERNQGNFWGTLFEVLKKTFLMFFTEGDLNWRHNVSGFPMLNFWASGFFALGFLYSCWIILKKIFAKSDSNEYFKHLILIIWFLGMLVPEILSAEGIPHGLRAIGAIPSVFFFSALIIDFLLQKINIKKIFLNVLLGIILLTSLGYDYYLYFGISANSPDFYYEYRSDLTVVSNYLNERNLKEKTYLVLDEYSAQTPEFLTAKYHQPYILVDPAKVDQIQLRPGDEVVFTQSTIRDAKRFEVSHPEAKLIKREFNRFNQEIMRVYSR